MFTLEDVFSLPAIQDLTTDVALNQAYLVLELAAKGEQVPHDAFVDAMRHRDQVEPILVEHYIDDMRAKFYWRFGLSIDLSDISLFADAMAPPTPHPLFSPLAGELIKRAWTALVISAVDMKILQQQTTAYIGQHPLSTSLGRALVEKLCALGLNAEVWAAVASLVPGEISAKVASYTTLESSIICDVRNWLHSDYLALLAQATEITPTLVEKLEQILEHAVAELRISQVFDLIVALPSSAAALDDLKLCMGSSAPLRRKLVQQFEQDQARILNNGVPTVEIFIAYLKCIKAFSVLDSRGILLDRVSKPIRQYLMQQPDSVKILVDGLMGEEASPLAFLSSELAQPARPTADLCDRNWMPDPTDTPIDYVARQVWDTITTLLSLFDNKDIIIVQLNQEFAKRLLTSDQDLHPLLENLKRRFGSRQLQSIDVMIHDVRNSARLNTLVHQTDAELRSVHAFILSKLYWPQLGAPSTLKLPERLNELLEQYKAAYTAHETDRQVEWLPHLGKVSVSVELEDRRLDLVVTPDQAAVLGAFEDRAQLSLDELLELCHLDQPALLAALLFWVQAGVLHSKDEFYTVLEVESTEQEDNIQVAQAIPPPQPEVDPSMEIYWSYIQHMLGNVGSLPLERIHSFLVMLVPKETPYIKTNQQLEAFLNLMVSQDKLSFDGDKYKLA